MSYIIFPLLGFTLIHLSGKQRLLPPLTDVKMGRHIMELFTDAACNYDSVSCSVSAKMPVWSVFKNAVYQINLKTLAL